MSNITNEIRELILICNKPMLTLRESALYLGVSEQFLYKNASMFRRYKPGKVIYFERSELDDYMRSNPIPSDKDIEKMASIYCDNKKNSIAK